MTDGAAQHDVDVGDGLTIHVETRGRGSPLVLLHGWPGAWFEFAPLWQLTPKERAEVDKLNAEVAAIDARAGLIPRDALAAGRRGRVAEDGVYPGIEGVAA